MMTTRIHRSNHTRWRGLTIVEVAVAAVCVACLFGVAMPLLAHVGTMSGESVSLNNLRTIATAHASYGATFDEHQVTWIPDNFGVVGGDCDAYLTQIGCPPFLLLGTAASNAQIGYGLGGVGFCAGLGLPGNCDNIQAYIPMTFSNPFGSFRLPNAAALNNFVDGRFFSDIFYAPNDGVVFGQSEFYRDNGYDADNVSGHPFRFSSYCLSPAAMYHVTVLGDAYGGWRDPNSFDDGYKAPVVTQCTYPDLKTRTIEHNWNRNAPSAKDPTFSGFEPWYFNASARVQPLSLFFDGHVSRVDNAHAIADDEALFQSTGKRLWSRATPLGADGYWGVARADDGPSTNHTVLTIDGIKGRDVLNAR